jgi:hypothetical protein
MCHATCSRCRASHPVVNGLDAQDLRDWAGSSNAREPHTRFPTRTKKRLTVGTVGNRGGVASAALKSRIWPAGARFCRASSTWPIRPDGTRSGSGSRHAVHARSGRAFSTANAPAMEPAAQRLAGQLCVTRKARRCRRVSRKSLCWAPHRVGSRCLACVTKKPLRCQECRCGSGGADANVMMQR